MEEKTTTRVHIKSPHKEYQFELYQDKPINDYIKGINRASILYNTEHFINYILDMKMDNFSLYEMQQNILYKMKNNIKLKVYDRKRKETYELEIDIKE